MDNQHVRTLYAIPVPNETGYFCDDLGNIYSTNRGSLRKLSCCIHWGRGKKQPYLRTKLRNTTYLSHRLVLSAKVGFWLNSDQFVNHINGDTQDNKFSNLEVVTHKENMRHASENNLLCTGKDWYKARGIEYKG